VLACVAKREVISQYEDLLAGQSIEPWGGSYHSSFNAINSMHPILPRRTYPGMALVWVAEGSYTTIIMGNGWTSLFIDTGRSRQGAPENVTGRLMRELDDSIHFYLHMDPASKQSEVAVTSMLSVNLPLIAPLSESLKN